MHVIKVLICMLHEGGVSWLLSTTVYLYVVPVALIGFMKALDGRPPPVNRVG